MGQRTATAGDTAASSAPATGNSLVGTPGTGTHTHLVATVVTPRTRQTSPPPMTLAAVTAMARMAAEVVVVAAIPPTTRLAVDTPATLKRGPQPTPATTKPRTGMEHPGAGTTVGQGGASPRHGAATRVRHGGVVDTAGTGVWTAPLGSDIPQKVAVGTGATRSMTWGPEVVVVVAAATGAEAPTRTEAHGAGVCGAPGAVAGMTLVAEEATMAGAGVVGHPALPRHTLAAVSEACGVGTSHLGVGSGAPVGVPLVATG